MNINEYRQAYKQEFKKWILEDPKRIPALYWSGRMYDFGQMIMGQSILDLGNVGKLFQMVMEEYNDEILRMMTPKVTNI